MNRYNTLCKELDALIRARKAPAGSVAPLPLARESLFKLEIDDPIWNDAGLYEANSDGSMPSWLGNDNVRKGIRAWLMVERCDEEIARLQDECCSLHTWFQDEWNVLINSKSQFQGNVFFLCSCAC
jgi:hypothetical protein